MRFVGAKAGLVGLVAVWLVTGCLLDESGRGLIDAGGDAAAGDAEAGLSDAAAGDAGVPGSDAGVDDAGPLGPEAGVEDAGTPDAGTPDAGAPDAGVPDAGVPDAGVPDAGPPVPADWWDTRWGRRHRLTFDNGGGPALNGFTALVVLDETKIELGAAGVQGRAMRFVDADGALLRHEVERWTEAGAQVWVRVPEIAAMSEDDFIWLYLDQPTAADVQNADLTWNEPYRGVWHADGDFTDSSGNGNDGAGAPATAGIGRIGRGVQMGMGDHVAVADAPSLDLTTGVTISAWIRPTTLSHQLAVLSKREGCEGEGNYALFVRGDDRLQFEHFDGGWRTFPAGTVRVNEWQWVAATFDPARDVVSIYIDGVRVGGSTTATSALITDANAIEIGRNGGCGGDYLEGTMDEVRLESVARGAQWMSAQYRSMTDALLTYGPAERIR